MWGGIWFQILGPQTEKARFANWARVLATTAALVVEERSWRPRFFSVEFDDIVEVCGPTLIKSSVHRGGNLELNSCLHWQPVKTL